LRYFIRTALEEKNTTDFRDTFPSPKIGRGRARTQGESRPNIAAKD
jgi:hypothetical protein